jgi:enolase
MPVIKSIQFRKILNSQVQLTNEFIIILSDGTSGIGSSPQGETISIYEDHGCQAEPASIISDIQAHIMILREVNQVSFDNFLQTKIIHYGRNNCYALSEAFFNACGKTHAPAGLLNQTTTKLVAPRLCLNLLNGGSHAYTNPVLSDFSEYILVARNSNIQETIGAHNEIQRMVKEQLRKRPKKTVNGHLVSTFSTADNRECLEFVLQIRGLLGYDHEFDLWIDASAGDLWKKNEYRFSLTNKKHYSNEQLIEYWIDLISQYNVRYIEDPFHETDFNSWRDLAAKGYGSLVIGDNLYSSSPDRIENGAKQKLTHGVLIKPNQAGTVTEVCNAIKVAQRYSQEVITSHRSISTESTFLSLLTCAFGVHLIKIGPLVTDFSAIMRLNEIIRLTGT